VNQPSARFRPGPPATWPAPDRVERLLDGAPAALDTPGEARLAGLLHALAVPPVAVDALDPVREEDALAAFRSARAGRAPRTGAAATVGRAVGPRARQRGASRALPAPAWPTRVVTGGLVAACVLGILTVAAGAGVLPGPFRDGGTQAGATAAAAGRGVAGGPARPDRRVPDGGARPRIPSAAGPTALPGAPTAAPGSTVPPGPGGPRALCRRYLIALRHGRQPGERLTERLRQRAGGTDLIAGYCHRFPDPEATTTARGDATPRSGHPHATGSGRTSAHPGTSHPDASHPGAGKSAPRGDDPAASGPHAGKAGSTEAADPEDAKGAGSTTAGPGPRTTTTPPDATSTGHRADPKPTHGSRGRAAHAR
jgi:hypothetical protein